MVYARSMRHSMTSFWLLASLLFLLSSATTASSTEHEDGNKTKEKKVAIVTLVTTSTYIPGALVLAESLKKVKAKGERILLWVGPEDDARSDMTPQHIQHLSRYWDKTIQLSRANGTYTECKVSKEQHAVIDNNPQLKGLDRYWGTCSKFAVWGLTDYDVVVYMDADSVAFNNFDFVFDCLDDSTHIFAAHGTPECGWDTNDFTECLFYTAFFVTKPLPHIGDYFHQLADQNMLAEGEITLLNQVISHWKPLPRYTLSAQTEVVRPINPSTGRMDSRLAKVYDFAGTPDTKPWISYKLAKEMDDPNWHAHFGSMRPGTEGHERYQIPQIVWNSYYDDILKKEEAAKANNAKEEL
jgi:glycogenin